MHRVGGGVADQFIYTAAYRPEWIVTAAEGSVYHVQNPVAATQFSAKPHGALLSKWGSPLSFSPTPPVVMAMVGGVRNRGSGNI